MKLIALASKYILVVLSMTYCLSILADSDLHNPHLVGVEHKGSLILFNCIKFFRRKMAVSQCPCFGNTPDWRCINLLNPVDAPTPVKPEGTQPGFINPRACCARGCCQTLPPVITCAVPDKLLFVMEWFDRESDLIKKYVLTYYHLDKTCEIRDIINDRRFLKRHKVATVTLTELFISNVINIYGRKMTIADYGDSCTRQYLEPKQERAFLLIRPHAVQCLGQIYEVLEKNFRILRCRMAWFTREAAKEYYKDLSQENHLFEGLISHVTSAPVVAFILVGNHAIEKLMEIVGDKDPGAAKLKNPMSLRAIYGIDQIRNGVDVSETPGCVARDSAFFFTECRQLIPKLAPPAVIGRCSTLAIIKPHALKKCCAGRIMYEIATKGFQITGMEMFYLDRSHAEEHYEIYRGVLDEFSEMTEELALGPCIVMEVSGFGECTPKFFREFAGPMDPIVARKIRPDSLRARYGGRTRVRNAVHCTDLEGDAEMEVEYFFKILQMME